MRKLVPLLILLGCDPTIDGEYRRAPADGQSDVAAFAELRIQGPFSYPDDQPLPPFVQVVDLLEGGIVPGHTQVVDGGVAFVPDGPWAPDRSFAWSVRTPLDEVRRPTIDVPPTLVGTTVFHTDNRLEPLAATLPATGELCLVFSRPLLPSESARVEVTIAGEPLRLGSIRTQTPEDLGDDDLLADDRGLGGLCAVVAGAPVAGVDLRIRVGSVTTLTPLREGTPAEVAEELRRAGGSL